jgi:hypothetical protein
VDVGNNKGTVSERNPGLAGADDPVGAAPTDLLAGIVDDLVFVKIVAKIERSAGHNVADEHDLHKQKEQLEHSFDGSVQIKAPDDDALNM